MHGFRPGLQMLLIVCRRCLFGAWQAGLHDTGDHQLHVAQGNRVKPILKRKHLALFRDAQTPIDGIWRLTQDSFIDWSATASDSSAPAMKNRNSNAVSSPKLG